MRMTGLDGQDGLAAVLDDHVAAEFVTRDVDATVATMTDDPYLNHVPVRTGGIGREEVRRFYEQVFIGHWPADTTMERISRTVGRDQVVDELVMSFTHDITMGHMLPGVPPTGRRGPLGGGGGGGPARGGGYPPRPSSGCAPRTLARSVP